MISVFKHSFVFSLVLVLSLAFASRGFTAGFEAPEQGQPSVGTANVGGAALARDASTAWFNPAGMTNLEQSEILLGAQLSFLKFDFKDDQDTSFGGGSGGHANDLFPESIVPPGIIPGGGFFYVQKLPLPLDTTFGFSITVPFGGGSNFDDDWAGRYFTQDSLMTVINMNPSLAFKVTDWASVGVGVNIQYARFEQKLAINNLPPAAPDGKIAVELDDWELGYNLGLLLTPRKGTRIGLTYRSEIAHHLRGDADLSNFAPPLSFFALKDAAADAELVTPRRIMVSVYQDVTDRFAVMADVGWANWGAMKKTGIVTAAGLQINLNRDWRDTWHTGFGAHYRLFKPLLIKGGFAYDSDPANKTNRLPDLPADEQWRFGAGLEYDISKNVTLSANWEFINLGKNRISEPLGSRRLSGSFDAFVNVVSFSVGWRFGKAPEAMETDIGQNNLL